MLSGAEILAKYSPDKLISNRNLFDGLFGKPKIEKVRRGGPWQVVYAMNKRPTTLDKTVLTFVAETWLVILSNFYDPWRRNFPNKHVCDKPFAITRQVKNSVGSRVETVVKGSELTYYTTVEGQRIKCIALVNPLYFSIGSIMDDFTFTTSFLD